MALPVHAPGSLLQEVQELGWWYQDLVLPDGTRTGDGQPPCYDPSTRWQFFEPHIPESLEGASVLDVGGNAGYFSLQCALRGAKECVIVEPFVQFAEQAKFVGKSFGVNFDVVCEDVLTYVLTTDRQFDYVLFLGLFYHLRYPVLVLDRLAQMTRSQMLFHTLIEESVTGSPLQEEAAVPSPSGEDIPNTRMTFLENAFRRDPTNWWIPSSAAMGSIVRSAGMEITARPHAELLVLKPTRQLGVHKKGNLVLSQFIKTGYPETIYPGIHNVDEGLWNDLIAKRWGPR